MKKLVNFLSGTIFFKLFALLIIAVSIPLFIFQQLAFTGISKVVADNYLAYKEKLNNQIVVGIDENINSLVRQSLSIYSQSGELSIMLSGSPYQYASEYTRAFNSITDAAQSSLQSNNKIAAITYFALDGSVKQNVSRYVAVTNSYNSVQDMWFKDVLRSNGNATLRGPHIPAYIDSDNKGRVVVSLARAVIDFNTNRPCGVIVIDQNATEFRQESFNVEIEDGECIAIFDSENNIVYISQPQQEKMMNTALANVLYNPKNLIKTVINKQDVIVSLGQSEAYGWKVVSIIPKALLDNQSDFIRGIGRSLLFVVLLMIVGVALICANTITSRLSKLKRGIEDTKDGNFSSRVYIRGNDEIARIGATFNEMSESLQVLIKDNYETNLLKKQAELEALQSQINPHFLFNTLNSIKCRADEDGSLQASKMIKSLSDLFRYSLNRGSYIVTISEELNIVRKYIFLQQCRFGNTFQVKWEVSPEIMNEKIVRLSLQPICENAFQHGLEKLSKNGNIIIRGFKQEHNYLIEIANDGKPMQQQELENINSLLELNPETEKQQIFERVGVFNVNSRIKFHYGNRYGLKFYYHEGYTIVRITLPCEASE